MEPSKYIMNFSKNPVKIIISIFIIWRLLLVLWAVLVIKFLPYANDGLFLGGGMRIYSKAPNLFAWANFDGEQYLSIAVFGYKNLQQAFFPVYPKLIAIFSYLFSGNVDNHFFYSTIFGLIISNLALLCCLILLFKLVSVDYPKKIAYWTIIALLTFPTSFFLGSLYSESLFLLLTLSSFYFARKKKWVLAGIFGGVASATRIFGILILPALILEAYQQKQSFKNAWGIFLVPLGLLSYMTYLWVSIGDSIAFYHLQKIVGEQHQYGIVFLPQIYYRYIKILVTTDIPVTLYQTVVLEFIIGITFILLPVYGFFKKIRLSYLFFAVTGLLMPSIPGSFSSLPRYVLVLFPSFIALAFYLVSLPFWARIIICVILSLILGVETNLFIRGYWVA